MGNINVPGNYMYLTGAVGEMNAQEGSPRQASPGPLISGRERRSPGHNSDSISSMKAVPHRLPGLPQSYGPCPRPPHQGRDRCFTAGDNSKERIHPRNSRSYGTLAKVYFRQSKLTDLANILWLLMLTLILLSGRLTRRATNVTKTYVGGRELKGKS